MQVNKWIGIFQQSINDYHKTDSVDSPITNVYPKETLDHLMYVKNWVDTVQWHLEDIIRNPTIDAAEALLIKRRIDASNQHRTDLVEFIDSWFLKEFADAPLGVDATYNTESPAWAIDRLSILELKIFHMEVETNRPGATPEHRAACTGKLNILLTQREDLSTSIQQLLDDIATGKKFMKVYKQMKMYNDESLNPVLYQQKK
ncbi:MAG: DUF4254 domain-containing protein [Rhizobacter sp.]|nr:DUF4254 domain-containing protein [Ferruginibacter sp.]